MRRNLTNLAFSLLALLLLAAPALARSPQAPFGRLSTGQRRYAAMDVHVTHVSGLTEHLPARCATHWVRVASSGVGVSANRLLMMPGLLVVMECTPRLLNRLAARASSIV